MQLLSEVHFSIHLCFIVLIANKPYVYFSFLFFFFFYFSGEFSGHASAMGREVSHGCASFILGLHVHAQETLFSSALQNQ